ncbi:unnamed protein product [Calypogeia fissa]
MGSPEGCAGSSPREDRKWSEFVKYSESFDSQNYRRFAINYRMVDDIWIEFAKYSKARLPFDSEEIKGWWSKVQQSSSLIINEALDPEEWQYSMKLLAHVDVSGIEHLEIGPSTSNDIFVGFGSKWIMAWSLGWETWEGLDRTEDGDCSVWHRKRLGEPVITFPAVLVRFSAVKTLAVTTVAQLSFLGLNFRSVAVGLTTGLFTNLRALRIYSADDRLQLQDMAAPLMKGAISQLTVLHVSGSAKYDIPNPIAEAELDELMNAGYLKNLEKLSLHGSLNGRYQWRTFSKAVELGLLPNLIRLDLRRNYLADSDLADIVDGSGIWFSSLEELTIEGHGMTSEQVCALVDAIVKVPMSGLALKDLGLSSDDLDDRVADAILELLVESGRLAQLQKLWLKGNWGGGRLVRLLKVIQKGCLPSLKDLVWKNRQTDRLIMEEEATAIAQAYFENIALTINIEFSWKYVSDPSIHVKFTEYRETNLRLAPLLKKLEEEFNDVVPLTSAKVFLCGYPEVGKTTLRNSLKRSLGLWTRFMWETRPKLLKEPRTKGIELRRIRDKNNRTLILWDLAGQSEFHILHGTFFADVGFIAGKATSFVLVLKLPFHNEKEDLQYWLKFMASSSTKHARRHAVIVVNCFGGNQTRNCCGGEQFTDTDKYHHLMILIQQFAEKFEDELVIRLVPFIIDVRVAHLVQPLKEHLFNQAQTLLEDVKIPKACFDLLEDLKSWSKAETSNHLPIFSWQVFEQDWKLKHKVNEDYLTKNLKTYAAYLHEMGEIIYFDNNEPGSESLRSTGPQNMSIVVPDPEWFCSQVVGQLFLPKHMVEGGRSIEVSSSGSIQRSKFRAFFEHLLYEGIQSDDVISMLEQVGLCYRKGTEEIIIPALIDEDDEKSMEWEGKGSHGVMGRCLVTKDTERSAIPMTLFRRLQVELAQDPNLGGCGDSECRAGKSFCNFKVGEHLVLIQFDLDKYVHRIDILVKTTLRKNSPDVIQGQVNCICTIMQIVQKLCVRCCPGLKYDIKVIKPWSAAEKSPKMTARQFVPLTEIENRLVQGRKYSNWKLSDDPIELKTFLSKCEFEGVLGTVERQYLECKRDAVALGLLTEESVKKIEAREDESRDGPITRKQFRRGIHEIKEAIHEDGHLTRQYIDMKFTDLLHEIQYKHGVLVRQIQELQTFVIEEKERSVPRYIFLSQKHDKKNMWISLTNAFQEQFKLHFLCEANYDTDLLHEVDGQKGIELNKSKAWLVKISPWVRRSLQVAMMVGKTVGNIYLPGLFSFIPDFLQGGGHGLSKAVDRAAPMLLEEDESIHQVQEDHGNYGNKTGPVDLKARTIAEAVVKALIHELTEDAFKDNTGLRKVVLRASAQSHIGSSMQASSFRPQLSVRWICDSCFKRYGDRATAI